MGRRRCCCNEGCVTFRDDFDREDSTSLGADWTECSGDWEIWDEHLHIEDADAVVACNHMAGFPVGIMTAGVHIRDPMGDPGHTSVGAIYRIHAYVGTEVSPCSAYATTWTLELEILTNTTGELRLYDPSDTLIGTRSCAFGDALFTWFKLCVSAKEILGTCEHQSGPPVWDCVEEEPPGYYFALGSGTDDPVYFEYAHYEDHYDHDANCPDCDTPCCCPCIEVEGQQPDLLATLTDAGTGLCYGTLDGSTGTLSCSALPGECCTWSLAEPIAYECQDGDPQTITFSLQCASTSGQEGCYGYRLYLPNALPAPSGYCPLVGENYSYPINECSCDPLNLVFGPFHKWRSGSELDPDVCKCCEDFYIVITEAPPP